ncbi:putative signal peptide protein [Puccinia sorghi]|uniref:Putative signal peptide protein n=1 Tax=Puccinia sorghi TaxID=27349 RepID=A0A0L6VBM9_9BASI|nr:putative signal peptide protein [Puccinia sorghi]
MLFLSLLAFMFAYNGPFKEPDQIGVSFLFMLSHFTLLFVVKPSNIYHCSCLMTLTSSSKKKKKKNSLQKKLSQLLAVDMQKLPGSFCFNPNISPRRLCQNPYIFKRCSLDESLAGACCMSTAGSYQAFFLKCRIFTKYCIGTFLIYFCIWKHEFLYVGCYQPTLRKLWLKLLPFWRHSFVCSHCALEFFQELGPRLVINLLLHPQNYKQWPLSASEAEQWSYCCVIHWFEHGNLHTLPPFLEWYLPLYRHRLRGACPGLPVSSVSSGYLVSSGYGLSRNHFVYEGLLTFNSDLMESTTAYSGSSSTSISVFCTASFDFTGINHPAILTLHLLFCWSIIQACGSYQGFYPYFQCNHEIKNKYQGHEMVTIADMINDHFKTKNKSMSMHNNILIWILHILFEFKYKCKKNWMSKFYISFFISLIVQLDIYTSYNQLHPEFNLTCNVLQTKIPEVTNSTTPNSMSKYARWNAVKLCVTLALFHFIKNIMSLLYYLVNYIHIHLIRKTNKKDNNIRDEKGQESIHNAISSRSRQVSWTPVPLESSRFQGHTVMKCNTRCGMSHCEQSAAEALQLMTVYLQTQLVVNHKSNNLARAGRSCMIIIN